jgi:hypothetical protein
MHAVMARQASIPRALWGDVRVLTALWKELGLDRLGPAFRKASRHRIDLEALLRVIVNRLCDVADSKLGVFHWLPTRVSLPAMDLRRVSHQQLLRTMDALIEHSADCG